MSVTVTVTSQTKKIAPTPDHTNNNVDANNKGLMFPFHLLLMMPTTIGSFVSSYRNHNDYSMAVFGLVVFSVFVLVDYCLVWYLALPKDEKSSRKFWMKVTMWFLYTGNSFGFVYLYSFFLSSQVTVALYAVMFICSGVLLSSYIITDVVSDWKIMWCKNLDAGKSNHAYSVLEKV